MPFFVKQLLVFVFLGLCLYEFFHATWSYPPGAKIPHAELRPVAFLWVFLPVLPFGAFVLRYGRPPEAPSDGDDGFWWALCAVCALCWALLKFVVVA